MIDKLERYFFDTFGIEPTNMCKYAKYGYEGTEGTWYFCNKNQKECWTYPSDTTCKDRMTSYPEITDHILLELMCIALQQYCNYSGNINIKNIKKKTLRVLLRHKNYLKEIYTHSGSHNSFVKKVRAVFKKGD